MVYRRKKTNRGGTNQTATEAFRIGGKGVRLTGTSEFRGVWGGAIIGRGDGGQGGWGG